MQRAWLLTLLLCLGVAELEDPPAGFARVWVYRVGSAQAAIEGVRVNGVELGALAVGEHAFGTVEAGPCSVEVVGGEPLALSFDARPGRHYFVRLETAPPGGVPRGAPVPAAGGVAAGQRRLDLLEDSAPPDEFPKSQRR